MIVLLVFVFYISIQNMKEIDCLIVISCPERVWICFHLDCSYALSHLMPLSSNGLWILQCGCPIPSPDTGRIIEYRILWPHSYRLSSSMEEENPSSTLFYNHSFNFFLLYLLFLLSSVLWLIFTWRKKKHFLQEYTRIFPTL